MEDFHADGTVSPQRFSASVYNAAPGLWSVFKSNRSPYTAIAGGEDTIECAMLEAISNADGATTFVYAEETGGGYGVAARFCDAPGARQIAVCDAQSAGEPIHFKSWSDFLSGRTRELCGRWLRLAWL